MTGGAVVLRSGVVECPLELALGFVESYPMRDGGAAPSSFGEPDLRLANRGGARISADQIATILERRRTIDRALRTIAPDASLAGPVSSVPWAALGSLFDVFAGIRGVGISKTTKTLHQKRPALIPLLDSIVQAYLVEDDLGAAAPFGERALGLVRGYKRDVDRNRVALVGVRRELARRGHALTEVRILDLLILSAAARQ